MKLLFILMLIMMTSLGHADDKLVANHLLVSLEDQTKELVNTARGLDQDCSDISAAREKICLSLGQMKGTIEVGLLVYKPKPDASLEELQTFPTVLHSHLYESNLAVKRLHALCGAESGLMRAVLQAQILHHQPALESSLASIREAISGKRCTNKSLKCP